MLLRYKGKYIVCTKSFNKLFWQFWLHEGINNEVGKLTPLSNSKKLLTLNKYFAYLY